MILYNPREWLKPLFFFHRSDTFRKLLPLLAGLGLFTAFVAWLEINYLQLSATSYVRNVPMMHNLLGFAISMLLVFRTNTAYDRWWEGRKMWGNLVNSSRNIALKVDAILSLDYEQNKKFTGRLLSRFAHELHLHLRREITRTSLDDQPHEEIPGLDRKKHVPLQIAGLLQKEIQHLYRQQLITGDQLLGLNSDVNALMEICGACERIKNTPIPYSYSSFIKKFVAIYVLTLPFGYVFSLGYIAIPVVMFIFYVLASLELIAEEIEDPFGDDVNDLPMHKLAETIQENITAILGK